MSRLSRGIRGCISVAALVAVAASAPSPTRAEGDVVEVVGDAIVGHQPADAARTRAIDRAFMVAVDRSMRALAPEYALAARDAEIQEQVLRRARLYVTHFQVREESDDGERYRVRIAAWIDIGRLRRALLDLGVGLEVPLAVPAAGVTARPKLVVLGVTRAGDASAVSFGRTGDDGGPVATALSTELSERGFELVSAAGREVPVGGAEGDLWLSDDAALELVRAVGAGAAVIVDAALTGPGPIRGTRLVGFDGVARVRVVELSGKAVARGSAEAAAFGPSADDVLERAGLELGRRTARAVSEQLVRAWPIALIAGSVVEIEVRGLRSWEVVQELLRVLESAPGVDRVVPRKFRSHYASIEVATRLGASRLARSLADARFARDVVRMTTDGERLLRVEVSPQERLE